MNTYGVDLLGRRRRRRHSAEFKAAVVRECLHAGVSIAAVALAHGLNANLLRRWVAHAEREGVVSRSAAAAAAAAVPAPTPVPGFVPLALQAPPLDGDIRIELQRGATAVKIAWPAAAGAQCAVWLREWLR